MLIAIVDDDHAIMDMLSLLFESSGYATVVVHEASRAYPTIKEQQPAVVIQDVRMEQPDTSWQVLAQLRQDAATVHIPVIIMSANHNGHKKAQEQALERSAFIAKPFTPELLLDTVKQLTRST